MSLICTQNDRFSWNLQRRKRPNTHGPLWIRWYQWKTLDDKAYGATVQKQGLHQRRTVVEAWNDLKL